MNTVKKSKVIDLKERMACGRFTKAVTAQTFVLSLTRDQIDQLQRISVGAEVKHGNLWRTLYSLREKGLAEAYYNDNPQTGMHQETEYYKLTKIGEAVLAVLELSVLA